MKNRGLRQGICIVLLAALLAGCVQTEEQGESRSVPAPTAAASGARAALVFTDALGCEVQLSSWERVASVYGSFAETWTLAGGTLVGVTSDAAEERGMQLGDGVALLGDVKHPSMEEILAAEPDFLILSADVAGHVELHEPLTAAGVPHAYYRVDTFAAYLSMLEQFCGMTGRQDLYEKNGLAVQRQIEDVLQTVQGRPHPTALLLRAFSTGVRAKGADNLAGVILKDLGAENLVEQHESLLEEVSLEEVIAADPDFIFVVTMGASEAAALDHMARNFEDNPAWAGLTAVREGRYVLLPKALFHYKPNARWGESYAWLARILYPELAEELPAAED